MCLALIQGQAKGSTRPPNGPNLIFVEFNNTPEGGPHHGKTDKTEHRADGETFFF